MPLGISRFLYFETESKLSEVLRPQVCLELTISLLSAGITGLRQHTWLEIPF